jgi:DNA processing protein
LLKEISLIFKKHAVSIVGTRTPTQYGKTATLQIVKGLVDSNLTIVSGMARGIDTIAHESTLSMNGSTIAVLGCGIDVVYPKSNHDLWERIGEKGVLVSEFNPGTPPEAYNFPRRNRIISGLSAATIVVEAGERSGSLITADYALQQGREVFAVPGPITSPLSSGTFKLLRDGAVPARSGLEIAESLSMVTLSTLKRASVSAPQKIQISLPENEQNIYRFISDQPLRIDELLEISGAHSMIIRILLNLELIGLIKQINGQHYIRTIPSVIKNETKFIWIIISVVLFFLGNSLFGNQGLIAFYKASNEKPYTLQSINESRRTIDSLGKWNRTT